MIIATPKNLSKQTNKNSRQLQRCKKNHLKSIRLLQNLYKIRKNNVGPKHNIEKTGKRNKKPIIH